MADIDKRTAILNAALMLIAEHGFHGTPMSQVSRASGVSVGNIYHYFSGKDDLIHALYHHVKAAYSKALLAGDPHKKPWPEHLKCIWRNAFHYYVAHPNHTTFLEQYENSPYYSGPEEAMQVNEAFRQISELIQADLDAGYMKPLPFEVLQALTLGVALNLAKGQIAGQLTLDDATLDSVAESVFRAVAAEG